MRKLLLLLPLLLIAGCSGEKRDCKSVRDGKFLVPDARLGDYTVERIGRKQIEQGKNFKSIFDVRWIDECTYVLTNRVVLQGNPGFEWVPGTEISITITEVGKDSVYFDFSSNNRGGSLSAAMKILE